MSKHCGESNMMGQAGPLPQTVVDGLQKAQSGAPTGKRTHKERLTMVETRLDVLEVSLEELYKANDWGRQKKLNLGSTRLSP
ncbi:hypothetical protein BHE74_00033014 [Ensete ventricosum]|nr:hypothetical protein GW17_00013910 [Ensete ventricosum]RWW60016.1 hypothetical protein BHE74_00033014 [Ensete ventricosum]RZR94752.1 hypothetical protein BHM03_00023530 [Ensete ventricosum]